MAIRPRESVADRFPSSPKADQWLPLVFDELVQALHVAHIDPDDTLCGQILSAPRHMRSSSLKRYSLEAICDSVFATIAEKAAERAVKTPERLGRRTVGRLEACILCHSVINCRNLEQVIQRCRDFLEMVGDRIGRLDLQIEPPNARLILGAMYDQPDLPSYLISLTALATYHRLFNWLIGEPIKLAFVGFTYHQSEFPILEAMLFRHRLEFGCRQSFLSFDSRYLKRSVVRTPGEIDEFLQTFPYQEVTFGNKSDLSERVSSLLNGYLTRFNSVPKINEVATLMGLTVASLRRKLNNEKISLRALKKEHRLAAGQALLRESALSVRHIAEKTGFSNSSAFSRSFIKQTGVTPSTYRFKARRWKSGGDRRDIFASKPSVMRLP